jgi:hypothetical protein
VIKAIKDPELPWCSYGQVIGDIKLVLHSRRSWIANHVKRETNSIGSSWFGKGIFKVFNLTYLDGGN